MTIQDISKVDPRQIELCGSGYELSDVFVGTEVRVFLCTGNVLSGKLTQRLGKYILVKSQYKKHPALINLDNMSSLSGVEG